MQLWEKIKAAKEEAEAQFPIASHEMSWEERDMAIFAAMVKAATGQWEPQEKQDDEPQPEEPTSAVVLPTDKPKDA